MPDVAALPSEAVPVALLYEAGDLGGHLKVALNELGASIVYESQASNLDQAALAGSGARIVVFNLDPESEGEIDQVCDVLDKGGYEVVFNDADASARLSGTDQARWARHLAAKILHKPEIAEPPRPAWAESVPSPGQRAAAAIPSFAEPVAETQATFVAPSEAPTLELPAVEDVASAVAAESTPAAALLEPLFAEIAAPAMPAAEPVPGPTSEAAAAASVEPTLELGMLDEFLLAERDADVVAPTAALQPAESGAGEAQTADFASALEDFAAHVPVHKYEAAPSDEFASEIEALFAAAEPKTGSAKKPAEPVIGEHAAASAEGIEMAEFPALFDQVDAAASAVPEAEDSRFSYRPAPLPPKPDEPATPPDVTAAEPLLPPDWSLEPLDEDSEVKPLAGKSTAFGIETMSASDYLAPEDEEPVAPPPISEGLSLELVPMEDAVAPQDYAAVVPAGADARASGPLKVGSAAQLRRVVVLGASIGGPEAVREFLGALPRDFPALFVLAQHMGDEFLDLMSMQLAKAVSMTVRTPTHGERVGHGEIVIVPTRQRMQIDSEGVITLSPLIERTAYSPSIDQVMRDVADEFGNRAGAIVFSGMAQDAIEGSRQLTARGGSVWAQDPETCTISTMVESVRQTGTVGFIGSPQQLAEKIVAEFGE